MSRPVNAPMISKLLKAGGVPRAGKYSAWGYDGDGFIVMAPNAYKQSQGIHTVHVGFSTRYEVAKAQYEQAIAVLEAEGYVIEMYGRPGVGGTYSFNVVDRNDA